MQFCICAVYNCICALYLCEKVPDIYSASLPVLVTLTATAIFNENYFQAVSSDSQSLYIPFCLLMVLTRVKKGFCPAALNPMPAATPGVLTAFPPHLSLSASNDTNVPHYKPSKYGNGEK